MQPLVRGYKAVGERSEGPCEGLVIAAIPLTSQAVLEERSSNASCTYTLQ